MAPCDWPISYAECGVCDALDGLSELEQARIESMATEYLWNWTLKAFGICEIALRPCRTTCEQPSSFWGWGPYGRGSMSVGGLGGPWPNPQLVQGEWTNVSCGRCQVDACSCSGDSMGTLQLPGPVASITEVRIDGAVLDPGAYRVDNGRLLVRLDGQPWPTCQDMTGDPATDENTFQITYGRGRAVPIGGQIAAGVLACEMAKAVCNDGTCKLPARVQTITRQGVTMAMIDNGDGLARGQTGIWLIDSWVASITNPTRPSTVLSPDIRPKFRTTY